MTFRQRSNKYANAFPFAKKMKKKVKKFWKFKNKYYLCTRKQETTSLTINNKSYGKVK